LIIYEKQFEQPFLVRSKDEYNSKSVGWICSFNCPEYLREAEKHILKEEERANVYL